LVKNRRINQIINMSAKKMHGLTRIEYSRYLLRNFFLHGRNICSIGYE
jgi:hypothetical protein